jgi:hypothetical protein
MVEGGEDLADLFGRILGSGQGRLRLGDRGTGNGKQQKQSADGHGKPSRRYRPGIDGTRGEIAIPVRNAGQRRYRQRIVHERRVGKQALFETVQEPAHAGSSTKKQRWAEGFQHGRKLRKEIQALGYTGCFFLSGQVYGAVAAETAYHSGDLCDHGTDCEGRTAGGCEDFPINTSFLIPY